MTVFYLGKDTEFPPPELAEPDGLLAVGGDLGSERLLAAYSRGIFPWYGEGTPLLWWCLSPRPLLIPSALHVPKSLRRVLNSQKFNVTFDTSFAGVIHACADTPRDSRGTWIMPEMIRAYVRLHNLGYAHSVEVWEDRELVGGLYGVSIGKAFFGESMFHHRTNASKVAFVYLVRALDIWGFHFVDCQQTTQHVLRFGAREFDLSGFICKLKRALRFSTQKGPWNCPFD